MLLRWKKRGIRAIDEFRKKIMIPDSGIPECPEFEVKSKIGKFFMKHNPLKSILLRFMKLILIFINIIKKEIQVDKNVGEYILFRTDIYFNKFLLAIEIDEKGHTDRDLIFEEKRQKALEKKLVVNWLELIQVM